jgi:hypothetical protein
MSGPDGARTAIRRRFRHTLSVQFFRCGIRTNLSHGGTNRREHVAPATPPTLLAGHPWISRVDQRQQIIGRAVPASVLKIRPLARTTGHPWPAQGRSGQMPNGMMAISCKAILLPHRLFPILEREEPGRRDVCYVEGLPPAGRNSAGRSVVRGRGCSGQVPGRNPSHSFRKLRNWLIRANARSAMQPLPCPRRLVSRPPANSRAPPGHRRALGAFSRAGRSLWKPGIRGTRQPRIRAATDKQREDPECFGWNELEAALFLRRGS